MVKDLILEDPTVKSKNSFVGALIGLLNIGTVSNVHVRGDKAEVVSTVNHVGGLVGRVESDGVVSSSSSSAQVIGADNTGGLVGRNSTSTVTGYATGAVSGTENVGGLVGDNDGTVRGYATGAVSGTEYVGGLMGHSSTNTVTGYATGAVSGTSYVGGLVGRNSSSTVTGYATGAVSGSDNVGGLMGLNSSTVTGYATGAVSGTTYVGGLSGRNRGTATGYALGYVIKKDATSTSVGPGIGSGTTAKDKVYVGRTGTEVAAEKAEGGKGDHVGVIAEKKPTSATKSDGAAPQGVVIEGSGTNVAANSTTTPPTAAKLYSKNEKSFTDFDFGIAEGEWTLGANNWPILNFPSDFVDGARTQNPSIPTEKPENFKE